MFLAVIFLYNIFYIMVLTLKKDKYIKYKSYIRMQYIKKTKILQKYNRIENKIL